MTRRTVEERFWEKVEPTGFCWEWTAFKDRKGYGRFRVDDRTMQAHRVAYELLVGPIPEGLHLDHLCRNTSCVNPDHLEPVDLAENVRRGYRGLLSGKIRLLRRRATVCDTVSMAAPTEDLADLITVSEAAFILGVDRATIYRWLNPAKGVLTPVRVHRRYAVGRPVLRVLRTEVQAMIATARLHSAPADLNA
jgi:predicted DNA-binding transcriptional regulator AlpA